MRSDGCTAGIWTGSVTGDRTLYNLGFLGEGTRDASVIVTKSHISPMRPTYKNGHLQKYNKTLHLVRNPFAAVIAERKRLVVRHDPHTANPTWATFNNGIVCGGDQWRRTCSARWDEWLDMAMLRWNNTMSFADLVATGMHVLTLKFESLHTNLTSTMRDVLQFLGEPEHLLS